MVAGVEVLSGNVAVSDRQTGHGEQFHMDVYNVCIVVGGKDKWTLKIILLTCYNRPLVIFSDLFKPDPFFIMLYIATYNEYFCFEQNSLSDKYWIQNLILFLNISGWSSKIPSSWITFQARFSWRWMWRNPRSALLGNSKVRFRFKENTIFKYCS